LLSIYVSYNNYQSQKSLIDAQLDLLYPQLMLTVDCSPIQDKNGSVTALATISNYGQRVGLFNGTLYVNGNISTFSFDVDGVPQEEGTIRNNTLPIASRFVERRGNRKFIFNYHGNASTNDFEINFKFECIDNSSGCHFVSSKTYGCKYHFNGTGYVNKQECVGYIS
jgi:hypothetical protein